MIAAVELDHDLYFEAFNSIWRTNESRALAVEVAARGMSTGSETEP